MKKEPTTSSSSSSSSPTGYDIVTQIQNLIDNQKYEIFRKDKQLARKNKLLGKKYQEIAKKNRHLAKKDVELCEKEQELNRQGKEIEKLSREIEKLKETIQDLKDKLKTVAKTRHAPFSKKSPKDNPQKPGRKRGHQGSYRKVPSEVDEIYEEKLDGCPHCQSELEDLKSYEQYITDIPLIKPIVKKYIHQSGWCSQCRKRVRTSHHGPFSKASGAAQSQLGSRVVTFASELKHFFGLPFRKISEILYRSFGVEVTAGGLSQAIARLAKRLEPSYNRLVRQASHSVVINADETSWLIGGKPAWLWVFTNGALTVYAIRFSRAHGVIKEILGENFNGVLCSDFLSTYDPIDCAKAKCLAHLMRELEKIQQKKKGRAASFSKRALDLFSTAMELGKKESQNSKKYKRERRKLEQALDRLIQGRYKDKDNQRISKRLKKYRDSLFTFLYHELVEPTNNQAERQIRPAVLIRKISAGNRTLKGAKTHEILASLMATCVQQKDLFYRIAEMLYSHWDFLRVVQVANPQISKFLRAP